MQDGTDADAIRQIKLAERLADQWRGIECLRFNDFRRAVLDRIHALDAAAAYMLQHARDRYRARVDIVVNPERLREAVIAGIVEQGQV